MERLEPGNKHKIDPAIATGGAAGRRGAQLSQICMTQWHCRWQHSSCLGNILNWGVCLEEQGLWEWTVAVSFEGQPRTVSCANLITSSPTGYVLFLNWLLFWYETSVRREWNEPSVAGRILPVVSGGGSENYHWQEGADRLWVGVEMVSGGGCQCWYWNVLTVKWALIPAQSGMGWEGGSVHGLATYRSLSRRFFPLRQETLTWKVPCWWEWTDQNPIDALFCLC